MNNSDQQLSQGFESSKIIIQEQSNIQNNSFGFRPIDYHPRVILKSRIFKKLPEEMNQCITSIKYQPIHQQSYIRHNRKGNEQRVETLTPQNMYESDNSGFQLVYSKYESKLIFRCKQQNFTGRQLSLKPLLRYQQQNYYLLKPFQQQQIKPKAKILRFDSKFQCGNLLCSYQSITNKNQYHLFLENDTNRFGYSQWFCFSIRGAEKCTEYTLKVMNMRKAFSFYKEGMKPIVFSLNRHRKTGNGWEMRGENIAYTPSPVHDIINNEQSKLYCLQFSLTFDQEDDFVTISAGLPYSYSRLITHLKEFKEQAERNCIQWSQKTVAYTLSNNQVPYLVIKKIDKQISEKNLKNKRRNEPNNRPIILIFARQHPGETNSSFIMQEFLKELATITKKQTLFLLERYQFHIFPMINIDGVIYGNFRCDLAGFDLNRVWRNPLKQIHPQIQAITAKIRQLSEYQRIACCFDFHSHSKEYNIFSYCCKQEQIQSRVLPYMLNKLYQSFSFPHCTFGLTRDKLSTARAAIFGIVRHSNVLTIETSSFAKKVGDQIILLEQRQFGNFCRAVLEALKTYFDDSSAKKDFEGQIKGRINELMSYQTFNQQQFQGSDSQQQIDPIIQVKTLDINLSDKTVKQFQGNVIQIEQANKQILKKLSKIQLFQCVSAPHVEKYEKRQKIDRTQSSQIQQQKPIQKLQIKRQQILAIIRTKQSKQTPKKGQHYQIKMPFSTFKANIFKYQHNRTQTIHQEELEVSKEEKQLLQGKQVRKNRSSLILKSSSTTQKDAMKIFNNSKIKPQEKTQKVESSMRFKLKSFEENSLVSFEKVTNCVGNKRNTDIHRMSRIQKILRVRKRVNTLKNINPSQSKNNINHTNIFLLKIGQQQVKSNPPSQITKVKHNKSSTTINSLNERIQHLYKGNTKNQKVIVGNHPNAQTSLIGQMWKINYGRYSKDLS